MRSELVRRQAAYDLECEPYLGFATTLIDCCRTSNLVKEPSELDWKEALKFIWVNRRYLHAMGERHRTTEEMYAKDFAIGRGIRHLLRYDIDVSLDGHEVSFIGNANAVLTNKFDQLACSVGGRTLIELVIKDIGNEFPLHREFEQFLIGRRLGLITEAAQIQIPWGFLLHLALKHVKSSPRFPSRLAYDELTELAKYAIAISGLQPYSHYEEMFVDSDQLLQFMQKSVQYDAIFGIPQLKPSHARRLYRELWSPEEVTTIQAGGMRLSLLLNLSDLILNAADPHQVIYLSVTQVAEALNCGKSRVSSYLDALSHKPQGPNHNLLYPPHASAIDTFSRPILRVGPETYLLLPRSMLARAMADYVIEFCLSASEHIKNSFGTTIEKFLRKLMQEKDILTKAGAYDYRGSRKSKEKFLSGECDIVVEDRSAIVFIECKKKDLTPAASGNDVWLVVDLSRSLIHSQVQAMVHESLLRKLGRIELKEKDQVHLLEHNDREIERVSLSMWGFGSLQSDVLKNHFLRVCYGSTLSAADAAAKEVIKDMEEKHLMPFREVASRIKDFDKEHLGSPIMNGRFLSVPNVMLILDYANGSEQFLSELRSTKFTSIGSRDFVSEYAYMRYLKGH